MTERSLWHFSDHCCRLCFGRILQQDKQSSFRCAQCGASAQDTSAAVVCCCGIKLKTGTDAGIRCVANKAPSPDFPMEIIAEHV